MHISKNVLLTHPTQYVMVNMSGAFCWRFLLLSSHLEIIFGMPIKSYFVLLGCSYVDHFNSLWSIFVSSH
uniref:Uncharacterized protein n=1 Tax=Rhizophora mucronata TaxID=61149 RepID=A0A2P2P646_RHIMU